MAVPSNIAESNDISQPPGKMEAYNNPRIGSFDTREIRPHTKPGVKNFRVVSFATPYSAPPGISVGLNTLDIGGGSPIRIDTYAHSVLRDRFNIHLNAWDNTMLYSACCSWLEIEAGDPDFQFGGYKTEEGQKRDAPEVLNTHLVTFPRAYSTPPNVVVWFSALCMSEKANWRVKVYGTHVTSIGFTLHADTWSNSVLGICRVSWVAYPAGKAKVFSGTYNTMDMRPVNYPQAYNSGYVNFDSGVFDAPPRIFAVINSLDMACGKDLNLTLETSNVSERGMLWNINSWGNSALYSAGASYIALG